MKITTDDHRNYEMLVTHAPICIHDIDLDGRLISMNPAGLAMLNTTIDRIQGRPYLDFVGSADRDRIGALMADAIERGEPSNFEFVVEVDGVPRHFASGFVPVRSADGRIERLMGLTQDISARVEALGSARESETRFRDLAETAAEFFWEVDADLNLRWATGELGSRWSTSLATETGNGDPWSKLESDDGRSFLLEALGTRQSFHQVDLVRTASDGSARIVSLSGKPIFGDDGSLLGWRGSGSDVTDERALAEQLSYQASHDELTGLLNRREFSRRLSRLVSPGTDEWPASRHVLCFIDLDQFKVINDTSGHVAGDELLRQLARMLQTHVRSTDLFARLGGDEFGIVMHGAAVEHAKRLLHSIFTALEDWRFEWEGRVYTVGASVGVVGIGPESGTVDQLLADADTACYAAKDQGGNRCVVFNKTDEEFVRRRGEIGSVSRITRALDDGDFRLFAQPIVPVNDPGERGHVEVLLRMDSREQDRLLAPGEFLPAAEQFGLVSRIDMWVVEHSLAALGQSKDIHTCAINLSGVSLGQPDFLEHVMRLLDSSDVDPARLCFEITETSAIKDVEQADSFISNLRARGCEFALDDFGSGFASFAYLKNLDVDYLKIDGTFVRNILTDPVDRALVQSITEIGKQLGKTIIAEWVENAEIYAVVTELGVDMAQGYHFGHPAPLEDFLR